MRFPHPPPAVVVGMAALAESADLKLYTFTIYWSPGIFSTDWCNAAAFYYY
jgi:hypothetical protein